MSAMFSFGIVAPGYYDAEQALLHVMDTKPKYSFGGKHYVEKIDVIPGNYEYKSTFTYRPMCSCSPTLIQLPTMTIFQLGERPQMELLCVNDRSIHWSGSRFKKNVFLLFHSSSL